MKKAILILVILLSSIPLKCLSQEAFNYNFFQFLLKEQAYNLAADYLKSYNQSDDTLQYCKQLLILKTNKIGDPNFAEIDINHNKNILQNKTEALRFYNHYNSKPSNYNYKNTINNNYLLFYQACIAAYYQDQDNFNKYLQLKSTDTATKNNFFLEESWDKLETIVLAQEQNSKKKKNKFIATGLSAIIPGLGKAYLGKTSQAISTFTGILLLGSQAWEAYDKGGIRSPLFIVFGGLSTLFYLGNLYGTYQLNHASLNKQKQHYHEEIMAIMGPMLVE